MRLLLYCATIFCLCVACQVAEIEKFGQHYQEYRDYQSLSKVVDLLEIGSDTAYVRKILGEPIDFGFDYRYTVDSAGPNGCTIGAVFHLSSGKVDDKWIDEICE